MNSRALNHYELGLRLQQLILAQRIFERGNTTARHVMPAFCRLQESVRACIKHPPLGELKTLTEGVLEAISHGMVASIRRPESFEISNEHSQELIGLAQSFMICLNSQAHAAASDRVWYQLGWCLSEIQFGSPRSRMVSSRNAAIETEQDW